MYHHARPYLDALGTERHPPEVQRSPVPRRHALEQLVVAAAQGDSGAWETLVQRLTARVRGVARHYRLGVHDVEDVVQTTWMRLLEHIGHVRDPTAVGSWLEVTARRESLRLLRSGTREQATPPESLVEPTAEAVAEERLVAVERSAALSAALARLPHRQQRLLGALLAEPDRSYAELSVLLEIPVGSIGPTRARSVDRLRCDAALMSSLGEVAD